jgi:prevent-host-death family protein
MLNDFFSVLATATCHAIALARQAGVRWKWFTELTVDLFMDYIWSYTERGWTMKLSSQIKPISFLKAHTAEIVRNLREQREPLIITQNGVAKVVIQDIESYEQTQETMALLKILALGTRQIEDGKVQPVSNVIKRLSERGETP